MRVSQTVILAAGSGSRLASRARRLCRSRSSRRRRCRSSRMRSPRSSQRLRRGRDRHRLRRRPHSGGRRKAMQPALRSAVSREPGYHTAPNGVSLLAAEPRPPLRRSFCRWWTMSSRSQRWGSSSTPLLPQDDSDGAPVVTTSAPSSGIDLNDATKVRLSNGRVTAIGKGLTSWDAVVDGAVSSLRTRCSTRCDPWPRTKREPFRRECADWWRRGDSDGRTSAAWRGRTSIRPRIARARSGSWRSLRAHPGGTSRDRHVCSRVVTTS